MATQTIARLFDNYADAAAAVASLESAGFARDDISLVANRAEPAVTERGVPTAGESLPDDEATETGLGSGATLGTLVGGGAGLLAGLGTLAIPGVGPIVAAGWLIATLTGAGVGAAAGGLLGSLTGAGIGEAESHVYAEGLRRGGSLVTLRTDETRVAAAEAIFQRHNAVPTDERGDSYRAEGWKGYDAATPWQSETSTNPPGTMLSRGIDDVAGTNISGAHPEHERPADRRTGT